MTGPSRKPPYTKGTGFTLIELLVTITIAAILVAVAVPGFFRYLDRTRLRTTSQDFLTSLNSARTAALSTGSAVIVCAGNAAGCSGSWSSGWLVFRDCDGDHTYDSSGADTTCDDNQDGITEPEPQLAIGTFPDSLDTARPKNVNGTDAPTVLQFSPAGTVTTIASGTVTSIAATDPISFTFSVGAETPIDVRICANGRLLVPAVDPSTDKPVTAASADCSS